MIIIITSFDVWSERLSKWTECGASTTMPFLPTFFLFAFCRLKKNKQMLQSGFNKCATVHRFVYGVCVCIYICILSKF